MVDLVLDGVSLDFPAAGAVVRNFCLRVAAGERFVLVGPSGSGKTTLLRLVAGLERPRSGRILIGGKDVTRWPAHERGVAMVFQEEALLPHLTVGEQLTLGDRFGGRGDAGGRESRVARAAERLRIGDLLGRRCTTLSVGERRRVAIGRALMRRAPVLLLDEPLSSLDAGLHEELTGFLAEAVRETGATCVWVTHDQAEALVAADRMGVLGGGELQQSGAPQELYERPANRCVAECVGRPRMCFLSGQLDLNGEGASFASRGGWKFEIQARSFFNGELGNATCGVRPEWLKVSIAGSDETGGPTAMVTSIQPARGRDLVGMRPAGRDHAEELLGYLPSGAGQIGSVVNVALDERQVQWFNETSGVNLQTV